MKIFGRFLVIAGAASAMISCASNSTVASANEIETVGVWVTDFSGKPPFKREFRELPAADIALLEIEGTDAEMERVWRADFSGHPPFKRGYRELPVVDASSLEIISDEEADQSAIGRTSRFKRHR